MTNADLIDWFLKLNQEVIAEVRSISTLRDLESHSSDTPSKGEGGMMSQDESPKICVDCKWCNKDTIYESYEYYCAHPRMNKVDLVTGKGYRVSITCNMQRNARYDDPDYCGPDAAWFEPADTQTA